jgi:hypothetical protein
MSNAKIRARRRRRARGYKGSPPAAERLESHEIDRNPLTTAGMV